MKKNIRVIQLNISVISRSITQHRKLQSSVKLKKKTEQENDNKTDVGSMKRQNRFDAGRCPGKTKNGGGVKMVSYMATNNP